MGHLRCLVQPGHESEVATDLLRIREAVYAVEHADQIERGVGNDARNRIHEPGPRVPRDDVSDVTVEPLYRRLHKLELVQPDVYLLEPERPEPYPPLGTEYPLASVDPPS